MLPMLVFLAVVCGLVLRRMTPEERVHLGRKIAEMTRQSSTTAFHAMRETPAGCDEFYSALRDRTRWTLVTPAIVVASIAVHFLMLWSATGGPHDLMLLEWGASVGPRTTNGGWWRLAAAMFLHQSWLHLIADTIGLVLVGALLERVVGRAAFAVVYLGSGLLAGMWSLAAHPVSVTAGAAGGVFGTYGLLAATMVWGYAQRSPVTIPLAALKRVWPGALVFFIYHVATEGFASEVMRGGLVVGFISGLILAARVSVAKPPLGRVCATTVATFALFIAFAAPLRGIADVPAAVTRVIALEERTAASYEIEVEKFRKGRMSAEQLATVADRIWSDVQTMRSDFDAITNVPPEHRPLRMRASEYLRLRDESWRLRVQALRAHNMKTLQEASVRELQAIQAFQRVEELSLP
jgi:membrane associated rhomboid family serine protease